jgi:hypothetical protein
LTNFLSDLAQARGVAKDPEAAAMIAQAVSANPDAAYLLVQHTILADQALHAAQDRIAALEAQLRPSPPAYAPTSFLGGGRPNASGPWGAASQPDPSAPQAATSGPFSMGGGLGSFLRNAGTAAVGVAGGEMLFSGLSGLFGGHGGGMLGGGYGGGFGQPVENITINEYDDGGSYNDGGFSDGGGSGDF